MKEQFVDYETSMKLRELKFGTPSFGYYFRWRSKEHGEIRYELDSHARNELFYNLKTHCIAPLWQQVEEWLWDKHKISIEIERISIHAVLYKVRIYQYIDNEPGLIKYLHFESPITCKIEGIKTAVKHLSDTAVEAVTPINTKTNDR